MAAVWDTQAAGSMGRMGSPGTEGNQYSTKQYRTEFEFTSTSLQSSFRNQDEQNYLNPVVQTTTVHRNDYNFYTKKNFSGSLQHFSL